MPGSRLVGFWLRMGGWRACGRHEPEWRRRGGGEGWPGSSCSLWLQGKPSTWAPGVGMGGACDGASTDNGGRYRLPKNYFISTWLTARLVRIVQLRASRKAGPGCAACPRAADGPSDPVRGRQPEPERQPPATSSSAGDGDLRTASSGASCAGEPRAWPRRQRAIAMERRPGGTNGARAPACADIADCVPSCGQGHVKSS